MIEAYRIGVSMMLETNMGGAIGALVRDFEKLNKAVQDARDATSQLAGNLRRIASSQAAINKMADAFVRMGTGMKAAASAAPTLADRMDQMAQRAAAFSNSWKSAANSMERASKAPLMLTWDGPPNGTYVGRRNQYQAPYDRRNALTIIPAGPAPAGPNFTTSGDSYTPAGGALVPHAPGGGARIPLVNPLLREPPERPTMNDATMAGMGAGATGLAATELVKHALSAGITVGQLRNSMITQGFSAAQFAAAKALADKTRSTALGTTIAGNLGIASKLMAVLQDPAQATKLMPEFAQLGVVLGGFGEGDEGEDLMSAIRGGEFRGVLSHYNAATKKEEIDPSKLGAFIHQVEATAVMTHGQVGPRQLLQFMRSSGVGARMMTDQSLFADSIALIMSMGAARAGTGIQGMQMQFSAGKMSEAAVSLLQEMGIIQKGNIKHNANFRKAGMGQFILMPGAFTDSNAQKMAREEPERFALEYLAPRAEKWIESQPQYAKQLASSGPVGSEAWAAVMKELLFATMQQIASRIPGGKAMADIIANAPLIARDRAARERMLSNSAGIYTTFTQGNPQIALQAFESAFNALMVTLADPSMGAANKALQDMTGALNAMGDWAKKYPTMARVLIDVAAGLAVLGTVAGAVLVALAPVAALVKIGKWVGLTGKAAGVAGADATFIEKSASFLGKGGVVTPLGALLLAVGAVTSHQGDLTNLSNHIDNTIRHMDKGAPAPSTSHPMPVTIVGGHSAVTVANPRDIARATTNHVTNALTQPPSGPSQPDPRSSAWQPGVPMPVAISP